MPKKKLQPMNPDSEAIYDAQISPLMEQIIAICKEHRIPMLATFQYKQSTPEGDGESGWCTSRIPFAGEDPRISEACDVMVRTAPSFLAMTISTQPAPV